MRGFGIMSAIAVTIAAASATTASYAGAGPCTSSGNYAVGAQGPAMSGGQLMAGVGNCRHGRWRNSYGYYRAPADTTYGYRDRGYRYYDRGYGYGYDGPGVSFGVGPDRW
jgi:hypothetical protein